MNCHRSVSDFLKRNARPLLLVLTAPVVLSSFSANAVCADEEFYADGYKPISNYQFFDDNQSTPVTMLFRAELAIRAQDWEHAVPLLRASMKGDDDDIDTHKYLALCLQKQYEAQVDKDPELFNECIKEWVVVLRNAKGPEKGLTLKNGVSLSNTSKWADEEGGLMAKAEIQKLTGTLPKNREPTKKFLARVCKPVETSVSAKMLSKKPAALSSGVDQ